MTEQPCVGDIWRWEDADVSWTVLLIKELQPCVFIGICLEDAWTGRWEFYPAQMNRWEKLV